MLCTFCKLSCVTIIHRCFFASIQLLELPIYFYITYREVSATHKLMSRGYYPGAPPVGGRAAYGQPPYDRRSGLGHPGEHRNRPLLDTPIDQGQFH